ncbi:hypothetical protein MOV61_20890 [Neorhizobium sp. BETTINA12A]|uniref:hypothetical protein n=1 Tax=Neorhizobium sp. BETTINA12A TaxID=2908924 RepID=UPI001FF1F06E|nr:hypothetical protein [Neorhizobium sp. BETTINA12A]MCJ9753177.1 hypothetical protein [Neorhizobium sp. BETTINA12A]
MAQIAFMSAGLSELPTGRFPDGTPGMGMGFLSHQQTSQQPIPDSNRAPLNGYDEQNQHSGVNGVRISPRKLW